MDAVRFFNITDMHSLFSLTPRKWESMMRGYQYRNIDERRNNVDLAYAIATANNDFKKFKKIQRDIAKDERKLSRTEEKYQEDKKQKIEEYKRKKEIMMKYFKDVREMKAKGEL